MLVRTWIALTVVAAITDVALCAPPTATPSAEGIEFFEKSIRPVFIDSCIECHGAKKQSAGLRLDTKEAFLKGSDSGPIATAGEPDKSLLVKVVRHDGESKMPPKKKLPDNQIAALAAWVKMGMPWPEAPKTAIAADAYKTHWAFLPVRNPPLPATKTPPSQPIDRFVQKVLEEKGLRSAQKADSRTLIRRATYDLTGLLPTAEEIDAFVADASPDAFAKLIDRLLASPHYGEQQARHWMDLARYADTKGYVFTEDRNYPYAYTYRDWLISSFNEDLPYDQFVRFQLAADREKVDRKHLAAMGFLTVGRRFLNNQADIIDDRIDVTFRTFMGLTVTCARCHDHKYDPIPINDYYSLYGVFASSIEPKDLPLIAEPMNTPEIKAFEEELKKRQTAADQAWEKLKAEALKKIQTPEAYSAYLKLARDTQGKPASVAGTIATERKLLPFLADRWKEYFDGPAKEAAAFFGVYRKLGAIPDAEFAAKSADVLKKTLADKPHPAIAKAFAGKSVASFQEVADLYGAILSKAESDVKVLNLFGPAGPFAMNDKQFERIIQIKEKNVVRDLRKSVEQWKAKSPAAPARGMVLNDAPNPTNPYVFKRGNPGNRGPNVPRQFVGFIDPERKPFQDGSGRLEMAKAIADPKNPLTARVMVNRVWSHLFGAGLVRTPSDFGVRTELPTHPELLDYLSAKFVAEGWSLKKLHREILLSNAYQQSSEITPEIAKADPENRLLTHMSRKRMTFEGLRDSLLQAAGKLDSSVGGKSVELFTKPFATRRSLYGFIDRQNLPGTLRSFDFALPDTHSPQRFNTTVPQQALYLMNNPFAIEQAKALASQAKTLDELYRQAFGRLPTAEERTIGEEFLSQPNEPPAPETWTFGYGNYDANAKKLTFTPLPHWTGSAWQGGAMLPDPKLGWCILNANGGHPSRNEAVIRRLIAPADGKIAITGPLKHAAKEGNGVRARVVVNGTTVAGEWKAKAGNVEVTGQFDVKAGQTVDLVVDSLGDENSDSFQWNPMLKLTSAAGEKTFESAAGFHGPREAASGLSPRELFAQILLLSNEFSFID